MNKYCPASTVGAGVVFRTLAYLEIFFCGGLGAVVEEVLAAAVEVFPVQLLLAEVSAADTPEILAKSAGPPVPGGPGSPATPPGAEVEVRAECPVFDISVLSLFIINT